MNSMEKENNIYDAIIIGAGPAGLMAGITAAKRTRKVIILEKNSRPGRKLHITGKGRCNLTNACDTDVFFENVISNSRFLFSSFNKFNNFDLMDFFEHNNVPLKIERGLRVFPVSDKAEDIVLALVNCAKISGAILRTNAEVSQVTSNTVTLSTGEILTAENILVATGGTSYPATGSNGKGYQFAKTFNHTVIPAKPSLVPLTTSEKWTHELTGLTLKNVKITLINNKGKKVYSEMGEMLFTHFGVSGPIVISASAHMHTESFPYKLFIDLKPALSAEQLDKRIQRDFLEFTNKAFKNSLNKLLPRSLIDIIMTISGISPDKTTNEITKSERKNLVNCIKNISLSVNGTRPLSEAIVTAGGISTKEINPSTMRSKLDPSIFFAGEVIDVDAYTGGFNLQIAFSTGYQAGLNI